MVVRSRQLPDGPPGDPGRGHPGGRFLRYGGVGGPARWVADLGPDAVIVVILPDSGRGYLSKLYDDGWMADYGFLRATGGGRHHRGGPVAGRAWPGAAAARARAPRRDCAGGIEILQEYGVSQMPVVKAEPPLVAGGGRGDGHRPRPAGTPVADPSGGLTRPVEAVMGPPLPMIGAESRLSWPRPGWPTVRRRARVRRRPPDRDR